MNPALDLIAQSAPLLLKGAGYTVLLSLIGMGVAMLRDPAMKVTVDQAIDALRANGQLAAISTKWFGTDVTK